MDLPLFQTVLGVLEAPKVKAQWTLEIRLGNRIACLHCSKRDDRGCAALKFP